MRTLVVSDIHGNLEAFEAVLEDAGPIDEVWCLGDVVGYGPDPNACVELLRSLPHRAIAGNHDWATVGKLDLEDFNTEARMANVWTLGQLSPDHLAWLRGLPETQVRGDFTLAHGSPCHPIWEYVFHADTALRSFECFDTPYCLVGHSHTPVAFRLREEGGDGEAEETRRAFALVVIPEEGEPLRLGEERLIINPGSVGQPRDGDARAAYAVLDLDDRTLEHRRVAYPFATTQSKMLAHGLPRRLTLRLAHGW